MPACASGFSIFHLLEAAAERCPDRRFLFDDSGRSLSFEEALRQSHALAAGFSAHGVRMGDRILLVLQNRLEIPLILFAAAKIGAIFSVLSPHLRPERFRNIVAQTEPALIFLETSTAALRAEAGAASVVWLDAPETDLGPGARFAELLETAPLNEDDEAVPGGDRPAFLVFTSGSTGSPRGVILSHANVGFVTKAIQARLRYEAADCIGLLLPMAFDYGLYQVFYAAMTGASLFVGRPEMAGPALTATLRKYEISVLPAVPTLFSALLKFLQYRPLPLPALRIITNTGDHLPPAHIDQVQALLPHVRVFPMYGLTECKRVSILLPDEIHSHPGSVGRPLDGTAVWAVSADGQRQAPGCVAQLAVSGPHVALGYWRDAAATAERFQTLPDGNRMLLTGDFGSVDADNFIRFHSRGEYLIKHRGHRLSPVEIEEAACHLPEVAAAGCIRDDTREVLCLFVTTLGPPPDASAFLAGLAERVEPGKLPDRVFFLNELPRTSNHKVDRAALRALLPTCY